MRFALLGMDEATLAVARAVQSHDEHELELVLTDSPDDTLAGSSVQRLDDWERLLDLGADQAVLIAAPRKRSALGKPAGQEQIRLEQVRRLAQAGVSLFISHPLTFGVLDAYEIEMAAEEPNEVVMPILPLREELSSLLTRCRSLAGIEQIELRRNLDSCLLPEVTYWFAHDVDLLNQICGHITKVSALGRWYAATDEKEPLTESSQLRGLGVQLATPDGVRCQWSPQTSADHIDYEVVVQAAVGRYYYRRDRSGAITLQTPDETTESQYEVQQNAASLLDRFVAAVTARQAADVDPESARPSWPEAIRSLELTEALTRSLRRERTIEVREESDSEVGAFKSTMASIGCLLLIIGLGLVVLAAVVAKVAERFGKDRLAAIAGGYWHWLLIGTLGGFLLLQLFRFVIPDDSASDDSDD